MPTVDLRTVAVRGAAPTTRPAPVPALEAAPRRIGLTLFELQHAAGLAGDAPLPFEIAAPSKSEGIQNRLGQSPATTEDQAYRATLASLHDPLSSLQRRGLVQEGDLDAGLAGAIGLLAAPGIALDVDVRMAGIQAKTWYRQDGHAVASLATIDGLVFEVGWFGAEAWPTELARVGALSEEVVLGTSVVPAYLDLPYELADAAAEASRAGRGDLLPVLAARHHGEVLGPDGPLPEDAVARVLNALSSEAQGRLRALVADVSGGQTDTAGVVAWSLLADGWRALRPHTVADVRRLEIQAVAAEDLAGLVA
ncbi:MAG: hypothetical protein L0H31_08390, partial [Nocardioidaceae bacterium]|nr:hypothetical protein [Nocardioidaceae bacterium]